MPRKIGCTILVEAPTPASATSLALFAAAPQAHAITTAVPPSAERAGVRIVSKSDVLRLKDLRHLTHLQFWISFKLDFVHSRGVAERFCKALEQRPRHFYDVAFPGRR